MMTLSRLTTEALANTHDADGDTDCAAKHSVVKLNHTILIPQKAWEHVEWRAIISYKMCM